MTSLGWEIPLMGTSAAIPAQQPGTAATPRSPEDPASAAAAKAAQSAARAAARWQLKLLPWMVGTLVLMTVAFLALSLYTTLTLQRDIRAAPRLQVTPILARFDCSVGAGTLAERQACVRWKVAVVLEEHTLTRRYHQANVALLLRTWIKYLGFLTGMALAMTGAVFVLGRLTEAMSELTLEGGGIKTTVKSVYPGIVLAALGTALMIATVVVNPPTAVSDAPVYLTTLRP